MIYQKPHLLKGKEPQEVSDFDISSKQKNLNPSDGIWSIYWLENLFTEKEALLDGNGSRTFIMKRDHFDWF